MQRLVQITQQVVATQDKGGATPNILEWAMEIIKPNINSNSSIQGERKKKNWYLLKVM